MLLPRSRYENKPFYESEVIADFKDVIKVYRLLLFSPRGQVTNLQKGEASNNYLCSMSFPVQGGRIRGFSGEPKEEDLNFQSHNLRPVGNTSPSFQFIWGD